MIIKYELFVRGEGDDYERLIDYWAGKSALRYAIVRSEELITLFTDGDEAATGAFYDSLGAKLPLSLYLDGSNAKLISYFPDFATHEQQQPPTYPASYPSLLSSWLNGDESAAAELFALMPTMMAEFDGMSVDFSSTDLLQPFVAELYRELSANKGVIVETQKGAFFACVEPPHDGGDSFFMPCDMTLLDSIAVASSEEKMALCSLQRPFVLLEPLGNGSRIWAFLPNDLSQILLSLAASKAGFAGLYCSMPSGQKTLKLISRGAVTDIPMRPIVHVKPKPTLIAVLKQGDVEALLANAVAKEANDSVVVRASSAGGEFEIKAFRTKMQPLTLAALQMRCDEGLMGAIAKLGEHEARLPQNLRLKLPKLFELLNGEIEGGGFALLVSLAATALGMPKGRGDALAYLDTLALANSADGGVRLDFVLENREGVAAFNGVKMLQTLLSYKLAGVPDHALAYSFFESIADALRDALLQITKSFDAKVLYLSGDLFAMLTMAKMVSKKPFFTQAKDLLSIPLDNVAADIFAVV